jgi:hypothetical protein
MALGRRGEPGTSGGSELSQAGRWLAQARSASFSLVGVVERRLRRSVERAWNRRRWYSGRLETAQKGRTLWQAVEDEDEEDEEGRRAGDGRLCVSFGREGVQLGAATGFSCAERCA